VEDLAHFIVIGQSGGGKSVLVNKFLVDWGRYRGTAGRPMGLKRWIIDKGDSYKSLCQLMGGAYIDVAADGGPTMNPFDIPPGEMRKRVGQLAEFVVTLINAGTSQTEVGTVELREIERAVADMADDMEKTGNRGSLALLADPHLNSSAEVKKSLAPWLPGGQYEAMFGGGPDGFEGSDFCVYNFNAEKVPPAVIGPVFHYLMMKFQGVVESSAFRGWNKLLFIDEAPFFFTPRSADDKQSCRVTSALRNFYTVAIKNWRKFGGAIGIAGQEPAAFAFDQPFFDTIRGGVPTKIYLKQETTRQLVDKDAGLGVPEHLATHLKSLDKGVFLVDQRGMFRFLRLILDPTSYGIFTTDPNEAALRELWERVSRDGGTMDEYTIYKTFGAALAAAQRSPNPNRAVQEMQAALADGRFPKEVVA
jgi:type IV secretory pathway VirB4 component